MLKKLNLIIADDHQLTLDGLINIISKNQNINIIRTAKNGSEVIKILESENIDIIIFDIDMPVMDGIELSNVVSKKYSNIKMLTVTMHTEPWVIKKLLKNNVKAIVDKTDSSEEIEKALCAVIEGNTYYCDSIKNKIFDNLTPNKVEQKSFLINLTNREKEVLQYITDGLTSSEIASKLFISTSTIESHRANLLLKFGVKNVAELIKKAIDMNFI